MKRINQIVFLFSLFITCLSHAMWTDLHQSAFDGNFEEVQQLLAADADVNTSDEYGATPLHGAAAKGNEAIVNLLLDRGATINAAVRKEGYTPLHVATFFNHEAIVKLLLDRGADTNTVDQFGNTPLHLAEKFNRTEVATLLRSWHKYEEKEADNFRRNNEVQSNRTWLNNVWFQGGAAVTAIAGLGILGYRLFKRR